MLYLKRDNGEEMIKVLHINTESGWRGGENQLRLFMEHVDKTKIENHFAGINGDLAITKLAPFCKTIAISKNEFIFSTARKLAAYCRTHKIDVIDAQSSKAHSLGLLVKRKLPAVKLVVHRRVDNKPGQGLLSKWKYRTSKVDHYIAISSAIKGILVRQGVAEERIELVPSAVDPALYGNLDRRTEKENLARAFSLDASIPFIGNASALSDQKGYDTLIKSMKILKDEGVAIHCFIAGDGDKRSELESLRMELGLDQEVTFLGFIKEVPTFLSALDVLTVPSNNEGLGTIILDGTYAGCAVIASNVGGIPEMIKHLETGLLVPPAKPAELANAIRVLVGDENMQKRLNSAAKDLVNREFSLQTMVAGNTRVLETLAQR